MGRDGRLRVGPWPKILRIHRRRRELRIFVHRRMSGRTSSGQPVVFAASGVLPIRANRAGRHGNCNRHIYSSRVSDDGDRSFIQQWVVSQFEILCRDDAGSV